MLIKNLSAFFISILYIFFRLQAPLALADGNFNTSPHGDPNTGVYRTSNFPRGECVQCHSQHAGNPYNLFTDNTNNLCFTCHEEAGIQYLADENDRWFGVSDDERVGYFEANNGSERTAGLPNRSRWPGRPVYEDPNSYAPGKFYSPHGNDPDMPSKDEYGKGLCKNCHDPHGSANYFDMLKSVYLNIDGQSDTTTPSNYQLCFDCHSSSGPINMDEENKRIADYYNRIINDDETSGHQIRKSTKAASLWPSYIKIGDKLPCYNCHNPHGSRGHKNNGHSNARLLSDQRSAWNALTNTCNDPNQGRSFCLGCHVPSDKTTSQWDNPTVEGIVMASLSPNLSVHRTTSNRSCYDCHGRDYSSSTGYNVHHPNGGSCTDCHALGTDHSHPTHSGGNSRGVDLGCDDCHGPGATTGTHPGHENGTVEFTDGNSLASTTICNNCHSQGGAYDGVNDSAIGAKNNWDNGVYYGNSFISGKELWCISCHDSEPANSHKDGSGIDAPNIAGNGTTYGYYTTGHGRNNLVFCLDCHDVSNDHLDDDAQTYAADEATSTAINPYGSSYRLKEIDGLPAMIVPRASASNSPHTDWRHYNLCLSCHNRYEVFGETSSDYENTNFWNNDTSPANSHWIHTTMDSKHFDSDWDGAADSRESCIACHNVHGSPTGPMIRHGELISPYRTQSYVPALNFKYMIGGDGSATATFTPTLAGGTYNVYAWWAAHVNRANNAKFIINHSGGSDNVLVNQEINGKQWNLLGTYSFSAGTSGSVVLTSDGANEYIMADAVKWYRTDGGDEVIVDEPSAVFIATWTLDTTNPDIYGGSQRYYYAPIKDPTASVNESIGGTFQSGGGLSSNHICQACHSNIVWNRAPATCPRISMGQADPSQISNNQATVVLFTAPVTDPDDNLSSVKIDLSSVGGDVDQSMYDDGSHGDAASGDGTYSYQHTIPMGIQSAPKRLTVIATDEDSQIGQVVIELIVTENGAIVVDDPTATWGGTWTETNSSNEQYNSSFRYHAAGTGINTATWSFTITQPGTYDVSAWWVASTNRATNAPYTIHHAGGSATVAVSQRIKGGCWNSLGTYSFNAGDYSVVLSDNANNYVIADAIKVAPVDNPHYYPFPVADNQQAVFAGAWILSTSSDDYGEDFYCISAGDGSATATWTLAVPEAGNYNIYAWWSEGSNHAANSPYTINYEDANGPLSATVEVCQSIRGGRWNYLGNFPFQADNYTVVLTNKANDVVIADAIKFELGSPPAHPFPIADNWDAVFTGPWKSYSGADEYGSDFQYCNLKSASNTATWTLAVPEAKNYNVFAWWSENDNRAENVKYTINHEGGSNIITVSQEIKGGMWNFLGKYHFGVGDYTVSTSDNCNDYVIADAIKFADPNDPNSPIYNAQYPIADNRYAAYVGPWEAYVDSNSYHTDTYFIPGGSRNSTATWTIAVPEAGTYNVYAWWTESTNRSPAAPYTINYEGGSDTVYVNQQMKEGRWNYLGNYSFKAGNYSVVLTEVTSGYVMADAIKFEPGEAPANPSSIADNWDAVFTGLWPASTWQGSGPFYGTDYQYFTTAGTGTNTCTWTITPSTTGSHNVYAWWIEYTNRTPVAPYAITHDGGTTTVKVCQMNRGSRWNYLGNYNFTAGNDYTIVLSDNIPNIPGNNYIIADAVKLEPGSPPAYPYPIVDNWEAVFSGPWMAGTWTGGGNFYASDYQYHKLGAGGDTSTWTTAIPGAGTYSLYTRWSQDPSRPTNAPYTIYYQGGSNVVTVNQTINGGKWMYLGSYPFATGAYSVVLTSIANKYTIADAAKWLIMLGQPNKGSQIGGHTPPPYSTESMTFSGELYDADSINIAQVVGNSSTGGWSYENMTKTEGITWSKTVGPNDWRQDNGYYFKITDISSKITFIGCGGAQYSIEAGYANNAAAETAVQGNTYTFDPNAPCAPQ